MAVTVWPNQICAWNWSAQFSTQLWTRLKGKDAVKYATSCILNVIKFFINVDFGKIFLKKNISNIACFDIEVNSSKSKSWKKANKLKVNTDSKSYGLMLISTIRHRVPPFWPKTFFEKYESNTYVVKHLIVSFIQNARVLYHRRFFLRDLQLIQNQVPEMKINKVNTECRI